MSLIKYHLFVCLNERPLDHPTGCCSSKASKAIFEELKRIVADKQIKHEFKVTRTGCLSQCKNGVAAVLYPQSTWYGDLKFEDCEPLIESILTQVPFKKELECA